MSQIIDRQALSHVLDLLRFEGSDNQYYEVKTAAGGFPETALATICAFANTPGGGALILGVDESLGFEVVGVYDSKACRQLLANYAKNEFTVPVEVSTTLLNVNNRKVVWAEIAEADKVMKPVKTKKGQQAFIRLYNGDLQLSEHEKGMFISAHCPSRYVPEIIGGL